MIDGALRSILLPAIGPAVAQLPSTSQTTRLSVLAFAVSMPAPTDVTSENEASAGLTRPVPASLAAQARLTLAACHAPSGAAQVMVGSRRVPYWQGGPAYQPMMAGYFGGFAGSGLLPGFLVGMVTRDLLTHNFSGDMTDPFDTGDGGDFDSGSGGDGGGGDFGGDGGGYDSSGDSGGFDSSGGGWGGDGGGARGFGGSGAGGGGGGFDGTGGGGGMREPAGGPEGRTAG